MFFEYKYGYDENSMETPFTIDIRDGYLARLSMPGYADCTEWSAFDTYDEAAQYLIDTYGDEY
jgi:hypothetical protein